MISVEQLQDRLAAARDRLLSAIEELPDEAYAEPGAYGDWSVQDVLANIAVWEAELVTGLSDAQRGKRPARLLAALAEADAYDAERYLENRDRSLEDIFDDLQGARIQLELRLEDLTDRDLNDARRYRWSKKLPLWRTIAAASFERERRYVEPLRDFAARWLAANAAEDEPGAVLLTDVEVWDESDE